MQDCHPKLSRKMAGFPIGAWALAASASVAALVLGGNAPRAGAASDGHNNVAPRAAQRAVIREVSQQQFGGAGASPPPSGQSLLQGGAANGSGFGQTGGQKAIAVVNGQPISERQFDRILMSTDGMPLFEKFLQLTVLSQAARKAGLHVGPKQIAAERAKILAGLAKEHVPKGQRTAALAHILAERGISPLEFRMKLTRAAYLQALSRGKIHVSRAQEKAVFRVQSGPKLVLRDIVLHTLADAAYVRRLITKKHENPALVAKQHSIAPGANVNGGLIILPLRQKGVPAIVMDTARRLKPHQLSAAIFLNGAYHLLYLVKRIPAEHVAFKKVEPKLRQAMLMSLRQQWGNAYMAHLLLTAHIRINNSILATQYARQRDLQLAEIRQAQAQQAKLKKQQELQKKHGSVLKLPANNGGAAGLH